MAKKIFAALLVLGMLVSMFAACDKNPGGQGGTQGGNVDAGNTLYGVEIKDLEGYEFVIYSQGEEEGTVAADELKYEAVNDAIYNANKKVENTFNCDIVVVSSGATGDADHAQKAADLIDANEYQFDISFGHDISFANLSLDGKFMNLRNPEFGFDFSKEWWPKYTTESLTVNNQMYMLSNSMSYSAIANMRVIFFNKTELEERQIEAPYEAVVNGKWTLDELTNISKNVYEDLNYNDRRDNEDFYGFIKPQENYCLLDAFDFETYTKDANGGLAYDFNMTKASTIVEKLESLLKNSVGGYIVTSEGDKISYSLYSEMFANNQALFTFGAVNMGQTFKGVSQLTYGILPMPKLDESQATYISGTTERPGVVPRIVPSANLPKIGTIIEAMSACGFNEVRNVYFESALKLKLSEAPDDAQMIDIAAQNQKLSFGYIYGGGSAAEANMLGNLLALTSPSKARASYERSHRAMNENRIQTIMNQFNKYA